MVATAGRDHRHEFARLRQFSTAYRTVLLGTSGLDALHQLLRLLQRRNVALVLADVNEQPLSLMRRSGFEAVIGAGHIMPTLAEALRRPAA